MKRIAALILTLALSFSVFSFACAAEADIGGQYYAYSFFAQGYGDYTFFFHFYENDPVLGSVFYAGLSNNGIRFAGLYTVEKADCEYACYLDRDAVQADGSEKKKETGTAPYTIHFMNWDGTEIDACGWDGEILYNDCEVISGAGSGPVFYHLDTDHRFQETYDGETGVSYLDFVSEEDPTCTVSLCHNKTYTDMMIYFIDGSWELSCGEDGEERYDLIPADADEQPAVLCVSADHRTAVYTNAEEGSFDMVNAKQEAPALAYTAECRFPVAAYNTDADVTLNMYDDGTCELLVSVFGKQAAVDGGTYVMNADHSISFSFENAGETDAALDMEVRSVVLHYVNGETPLGAMDVSLPIQKAEEDAPAAELVLAIPGSFTVLELYDDNSYVFTYAGAGLTEKGTWSFEHYRLKLTREDGVSFDAAMDDAHTLTIEFTAQASEKLKDTFVCESSVWGPKLVK